MIKNYIDRCFVINLDFRKDRWIQVQKELKKVDLNYERFSAIFFMNKKSLNVCEYNKFYLAGSDKNKYLLSCCGVKRSHVEIIKIAKKRKYKNVLILEDDVVFHDEANEIFEKTIKQLKDIKWDILFLGANHIKPFIKINENLARIVRCYAIHAYIIKKTLYDFIINNAILSGQEIDVFYADEVLTKYDCYCVRPHIAWQRAGFSDILQGNRNYKCLRR